MEDEKRILVAQKIASAPSPSKKRCLVGFDGTADEILIVVDQRHGPDQFDPLPTILSLGERISGASGKSCNLELVQQQRKIGGNGPILTVALLEGHHLIDYIGTLGDPDPLFAPMTDQCSSVVSLGPSSTTWALEFEDGKVLLGRLEAFRQISLEKILEKTGRAKWIDLHEWCDLFVSANWTMLLEMNRIWRHLAEEVCPLLSDRKRWMFVDLADPAKRSDEDLKEALHLLGRLEGKYQVVLGLNESEARRIADVCGAVGEDLQNLSADIREKVGISQIAIHATHYAVGSDVGGSYRVEGPYTGKPILTTGGGDNFNAGYCNGLLLDLGLEGALLMGVSTSGYYVSHAKSPSLEELAQFIQSWHAVGTTN